MNHRRENSLTEGPVLNALLAFAIPLFASQLLQQFYNMADAWVVGNFADNEAFAAVSMAGTPISTVVGLFNGLSVGGGVVISRYFGAKEEERLIDAIHTNLLISLLFSLAATAASFLFIPVLLSWMNTPDNVMPQALPYFQIYFGGISTVILYNCCMGIMRSLGDSLRPLFYLGLSTVVNVILDLLFVAGFKMGAAGAAIATIIAQGISVALCLKRMWGPDFPFPLSLKKLRPNPEIMGQVLSQGLPAGVQNSLICIGNLVVQSNINTFGSYAIAGHGAFSKLEGFALLPVLGISMALTTFVSQNLGAGQFERARKGAVVGILFSMALAEVIGVFLYFHLSGFLGIFAKSPEAVSYGMIHGRTVSLFLCLLAFSNCASGALRGFGKSAVSMFVMLICWCGIRVVFVTAALRVFPVFQTISAAYPLTWSLSTLALFFFLFQTCRHPANAPMKRAPQNA